MGSYMMHVCSAIKLKKEHNYSDEFIVGAVAPDILKERRLIDEFHYITKIEEMEKIRERPDISKFIEKNYNQIIDNDYFKGMLLHVVMDRIWFDKYIPKYADTIDNDDNYVKIISDNKVVCMREYKDRIREDYSMLNSTLFKEYRKKLEAEVSNIDANKVMNKYQFYNQIGVYDLNLRALLFNFRLGSPDIIPIEDVDKLINDTIDMYNKVIEKIVK